ncbi:unnamed protein product [Cochlearia groenlandica]
MASTPVPKDATAVFDLKLGRSDQFIVCRLLRYWDSKNVKKQGEFMGINYAVFVVGDKDMVSLTKQKAITLLNQEVLNADADMLPPVLDQLRGCDFVFHVLQTNGSTTHTSPFTVVGISEVVRHDHGPALPQNLVEEEA